ncbi:actin maturation protease-like [Physella acuta]|uniref:actin maturation protease-like n=1 Tax=Physella acuta TaxID=109671 RepID=UPI0027DB6451|nr:actin maturation protease-like [Physella acuta]XP_059150048.1 actin maturation protease-like [Physella acuta]XP_059150049.1 actin maturation protease-like [Physella acuta]
MSTLGPTKAEDPTHLAPRLQTSLFIERVICPDNSQQTIDKTPQYLLRESSPTNADLPRPVAKPALTPEAPVEQSSQVHKQHAFTMDKPFTTLQKESRKAFKYFHCSRGLQENKATNLKHTFLSSYSPVKPVLQNGPICGFVALAMAAQLTHVKSVTTEEIFLEAKHKGFSKQGEMFSAQSMQEMASIFLACKVEHVHQTQEKLTWKYLVQHLMKGSLLLVPYDADRNHSPCQKKGHKAHWALITGFFAAFKSSEVPEWLTSECERDEEMSALYFWPEGVKEDRCEELTSVLSPDDLFVFGHHGKSKYPGVWSFQDLLVSNGNLVEAGPVRNSEDYVLPAEGLERALKSQLILLHKNIVQ